MDYNKKMKLIINGVFVAVGLILVAFIISTIMGGVQEPTPAQIVVECSGDFSGFYQNDDDEFIHISGCGNTTFNITDGVQYFYVQMDQGLPGDFIGFDIYEDGEVYRHDFTNKPYGELEAIL